MTIKNPYHKVHLHAFCAMLEEEANLFDLIQKEVDAGYCLDAPFIIPCGSMYSWDSPIHGSSIPEMNYHYR